MSDSCTGSPAALNSRYRCPEKYDVFLPQTGLSAASGFFTFGKNVVCYGRGKPGAVSSSATGHLQDLLSHVLCDGSRVTLPFDPREIIENFRRERYINESKCAGASNVVQKLYYTFRPCMPVAFRKHLQRMYLHRWRQIAFPRWPVDRTVEDVFEQLVLLSLESCQVREMPFVWFWPEGANGCLIVTHDIETAYGRDLCPALADLDASFGIKSSFQVVPRDRYKVSDAFLDSLRARGREINLHGLTHDGQLFRNLETFKRDAKEINAYAAAYGAAGFRSPVMYRNLDWLDDLDLSYDMSVPNTAHLDPQRGGCCTVMPYFAGHILELPLTTTQDYSLFNILNERSIELWEQQIELILEKHGLISFNVHPDYSMAEPYQSVYRQLLAHLRQICAERNVWIALPGEVNRWWRQRQEMRVVRDGNGFRIAGSHAARATLGFARSVNGSVCYETQRPQHPSIQRAAEAAVTYSEVH
jgi:hypothetical protein